MTAEPARSEPDFRRPRKSSRRIEIVHAIARALSSGRVLGPLGSKEMPEHKVKLYMHRPLVEGVQRLMQTLYPGQRDHTYRTRADAAVYWEGDQRTVINHVTFLGVQHRPDFVVDLPREQLRIAVEIKWGGTGSDIRAGIG